MPAPMLTNNVPEIIFLISGSLFSTVSQWPPEALGLQLINLTTPMSRECPCTNNSRKMLRSKLIGSDCLVCFIWPKLFHMSRGMGHTCTSRSGNKISQIWKHSDKDWVFPRKFEVLLFEIWGSQKATKKNFVKLNLFLIDKGKHSLNHQEKFWQDFYRTRSEELRWNSSWVVFWKWGMSRVNKRLFQ